ncbi:MAG: hypothetical protein ABJB16_04075 [Saprospiraceae bacterium]
MLQLSNRAEEAEEAEEAEGLEEAEEEEEVECFDPPDSLLSFFYLISFMLTLS